MDTVPDKLNGYDVVEKLQHLNGITTVMVKRGTEDYIVATWWRGLGKTWSWGHYCGAYFEAVKNFKETAERNSHRGRVNL